MRFFTPLSEAYRVVILYNVNKNMFEVGADDNEQGGAKFTYYPDRGEFVDDWCSDPETSVEEYFLKAYDGSVENVYQHSIDLMVNYIRDRFGLSIDELYALPSVSKPLVGLGYKKRAGLCGTSSFYVRVNCLTQ